MGSLDGIRVIEIANWAAAPSAGVLLAEHGAEVIKIEPPDGDSMRGLMQRARVETSVPIDHAFQFSNRQKKSVAIALNTDAGTDLALELIATADIVIMNLMKGRRQRLGLLVDDIRERTPSVIVGLLTGFGETGPDADRPGYDLTSFFARSGLSASVGGFEGQPPRWRAAQGDHVAGLSLYAGLVTALVERASTGLGSVVETSLLQSAGWSNAFDLTRAAADGRPAKPKDRYGAVNITSEAFRCRDGRYVQLSLAEPVKGWKIMCDVLELVDLEHDEKYHDVVQRFANMAELIDLFAIEIAKHDSVELVDAITARGGVAARVMQSHEVVVDPQTIAVNMLRPVEHEGESFDVVNSPFALRSTGDRGVPKVAAGIGLPGANTDEVLGSLLDLDDVAIAELAAQGVIGRSSPSV